jgi:hypothetical protein
MRLTVRGCSGLPTAGWRGESTAYVELLLLEPGDEGRAPADGGRDGGNGDGGNGDGGNGDGGVLAMLAKAHEQSPHDRRRAEAAKGGPAADSGAPRAAPDLSAGWDDKRRTAQRVDSTRFHATRAVQELLAPQFDQHFFFRGVFPKQDDGEALDAHAARPPFVCAAVFDEEPGDDEMVGEGSLALRSKRSEGEDLPLTLRYGAGAARLQLEWRAVPSTPLPWLKVTLVGASMLGGDGYRLPQGGTVVVKMVVGERGSAQRPPSLEPVRRFHQRWKAARADRRHSWRPKRGSEVSASHVPCEKMFWFRVNDAPDEARFPTLLQPELHIAFFASSEDAAGARPAAVGPGVMLGETVIPVVLPGEAKQSRGVEAHPLVAGDAAGPGSGASGAASGQNTGQNAGKNAGRRGSGKKGKKGGGGGARASAPASGHGVVQLRWEHLEHPETALRRWRHRKEILELEVSLQAQAEEHRRCQRRHARKTRKLAEGQEKEEVLLRALEAAVKKEEETKRALGEREARAKQSEEVAEQAAHLAQEAQGVVSQERTEALQKDFAEKQGAADRDREARVEAKKAHNAASAEAKAAREAHETYLRGEMEKMKRALKRRQAEKAEQVAQGGGVGSQTRARPPQTEQPHDGEARHAGGGDGAFRAHV